MPLPWRRVRCERCRERGAASNAAAHPAHADRRRSHPGAALMASNVRSLLDWIDSRTNYQTGRKHLLDEPLAPNVGWWFITGAVLMFLLGIQFLTGLVLAMYYVSSPELAYDSVRFITD